MIFSDLPCANRVAGEIFPREERLVRRLERRPVKPVSMLLQNKQPFADSPVALAVRPSVHSGSGGDADAMLWTIAGLLLLLWLFGLVGNYMLGGFIHVLLILAAIVIVLRLVQGRSII